MDPGVAAPLAAGPSLARAGLMVAPAMAVANGLNYAFNLVMLRLLEPAAYGALGALLAVILIGTVPALAAFLHLGSIVLALWLAANILPLPLVSALQGMLQGVQRFGALAAALLLNAGARLAVGVGLVAAGHGVDGALAASVAGSVLAMLLPLTLLRPMLAGRGVPSGAPPGGPAVPSGAPRPAPTTAALGREVGAAALAFLGLLLLTNVDLLLARHYLAAEPSGLYAAGAVVAKIAYWAPQFVATIVFPRLATEAAARRRLLARAAAAITALGVALMVVVAAAPELAVTLPFGAAYRDVGPDLPLFAALGTALALVQLLLFSGIAAGDRKVHRLLGATVVIEVAVIALGPHHSVTGIVGAALAAVTALLGACWVLERRRQPVEAAP